MSYYVEVVEGTKGALNQDVWKFWINDMRVKLESYVSFQRQTKRHHFKATSGWFRLGHDRGEITKKEKPALIPDDIQTCLKSRIAEGMLYHF